MKVTSLLLAGVVAVGMVFAAACGGNDDDADTNPSPGATATPAGSAPAFDLVQASVDREAPGSGAPEAARSGADLGFDIFRALGGDENLAISPYSIQVALAMARAGAAGETLAEMDAVLGAGAGYDEAMNALDQLLLSRAGEYEIGDGKTVELELATANSLWGQGGYTFEDAFLEDLARWYGAGLRLVDYVDPEAREEARLAINAWVSEQTNERIPNLLPEGVLNDMTRLVLTNAVYLKAPWLYPFDEDDTGAGQFTRLDGTDVDVEMMQHSRKFSYAEGDGYAAAELPYAGGELAMLLVVPDEGEFETVASTLDAEMVEAIAGSLTTYQLTLGMPKFEFRAQSGLKDVLAELGMPTAFDPNAADFTGMNPDEPLFIADVLHEAFVSVDEEGTEAAAATAVLVETTSAPPPADLTIDRPFFFLVRDIETGAVLFVGQVTNPAAE